DMTEREWDHVLDINLKGSFLAAQAGARAMVAAGRTGAIVNISSSAVRGDPRGVHYSASKAGVIGLTRAMALALAPPRTRGKRGAPPRDAVGPHGRPRRDRPRGGLSRDGGGRLGQRRGDPRQRGCLHGVISFATSSCGAHRPDRWR